MADNPDMHVVTVAFPCPWFARMLKDYRAIGDNGMSGGSLHIILEDGNFEDEHVDWCIKYATEEGDGFGVLLATMLRVMPEDERWRACGWSAPPESDE